MKWYHEKPYSTKFENLNGMDKILEKCKMKPIYKTK